METWRTTHGKQGEIIATLLAYCIAGHHGGLPDYDDTLEKRLEAKFHPIPDYGDGLNLIALPKITTLFSCIQNRFDPSSLFDPFAWQFLVRMLYSCLTDADFLDTEEFCTRDRSDLRTTTPWPALATLAQRLEDSLSTRGFLTDTPPSLSETITDRPQAIQQARAAILHWCRDAAAYTPGVFTLTVPTGGGKTLSSMAFALRHAQQHALRRVILVVPYTSIIEQNAHEYRVVLGDDAVLEHHCQYQHPFEQKAETDQSHDLNATDAAEATRFRLATENWDAPLIVTTAVQFFESLFANRSSRCRKLHNIAGSVIILDEAQMMPVTLLEPTLRALRELVERYGCSLVFCTATQPTVTQSVDLKTGFAADKVREIIPAASLPPLFDIFRRTQVERLGTLSDDDLMQRLNQEPQVLCIVNTRNRAKELFDRRQGEGWFHLSARMTPAHRETVLNTIRETLREGKPCRIISTSLIECGVDISLPVVFREETGLDSIAQAAGRCNRHGKDETGRVYVFTPEKPSKNSDLQRRTALFRDVADHHDDLFGPAAVTDYFKKLYHYDEPDKKGILRNIIGTNPTNDLPCQFPFQELSQDYRLIEQDMIPIIIESRLPDDLKTLLRGYAPLSPTVFRTLQRHTVQVYTHELPALSGSVETLRDSLWILTSSVTYNEETGLIIGDAVDLPVKDLIW